jgi:hypothetical protein
LLYQRPCIAVPLSIRCYAKICQAAQQLIPLEIALRINSNKTTEREFNESNMEVVEYLDICIITDFVTNSWYGSGLRAFLGP